MSKKDKITGLQKVAILLISLGSDHSSKILKNMRDSEIEKLSIELSKIKDVDQDTKREVLKEYYDTILAGRSFEEGGIDYASEVLAKTLGQSGAENILDKLKEELESKPFTMLRDITPNQLLNIIQNEHPQVTALILSHAQPEQAASVLENLEPSVQLEVAERIAKMSKYSTEYVEEVEAYLESRMSGLSRNTNIEVGGPKSLATIMNKVPRATEKNILEFIQYSNESLAESIRAHLFTFDDIATSLDQKSLAKLVGKISTKDWALALKSAYPGVAEAIFSAMSERAREMVLDEQSVLGQQPMREIERVQKHIVEIVRSMEESGEIIVNRGGDEVFV